MEYEVLAGRAFQLLALISGYYAGLTDDPGGLILAFLFLVTGNYLKS
jgi:hypothetical protein